MAGTNRAASSPTWGLLVQAGTKAGALSECLQILSEFADICQKASGVRTPSLTPGPQPFNNLLTAYRLVADYTAMEEVLKLMHRAAVVPDMYTYSILITAVSNGLPIAVVQNYLQSRHTYKEEVRRPSVSDKSVGIELIVTDILHSGSVPNPAVWRCVCRHFVATGDLLGLQRLTMLVLAHDPFVLVPTGSIQPIDSSSRELYGSKKHDALVQKAWIEARGELWSDLIGAAGQLGCWEEALASLQALENMLDQYPNRKSVITGYDRHTCWIRAVRAAISSGGVNTPLPWRRALQVLKEIRRVYPKGVTLTLWKSVLFACAENGTTDDVVELLQRMRALDGHFPDEITWDSVVNILARKGTVMFEGYIRVHFVLYGSQVLLWEGWERVSSLRRTCFESTLRAVLFP